MLMWAGLALATLATAAISWQLWLLPSMLLKGVRLGDSPGVTDWTADPPSPEVAAWIDGMGGPLLAAGFKAGQRTVVRGEVSTSVVWRAHLRHTQDRTRAAVSAWFLATDGGLTPVGLELTLQGEAAGGKTLLLTTGDDVDDSLWPTTHVTVVLAGEPDAAVALACFRRRLIELGADLPRARKNKRDGPAEVAWRRQELFLHQAELGLLKLNEDTRQWRLTWNGACVNAFYRFWPLHRRTVRRQRREARRLRQTD